MKKTLLDRAVRPALRLLSRFSQRRCEACGARVAVMLPYGRPRRWGAQCPECQALERHRFHARLLRERCPPSGDALVVAPDPATLRVVEGIDGLDVTTTDLNRDDVTVRADITALPFPDGSFRLVVCSHVLEHVPDDAAALGQLARVLHSDGVALIAVPMRPGDTIEEDLAPLSAQERERRFGQADHLRWYVFERFAERLTAAGFRFEACWPEQESDRSRAEPAFLCRVDGD